MIRLRRRSLGLALTAALPLTLVAACGVGVDQDTTLIRVAGTWSADHPMSAAVDDIFVNEVRERSGGSLEVEVYHSGVLGNEADLWDSVRNGTIQMVIVGSTMNQEYPTMLISDWPLLYRDVEHARAVWTGEVAEEMSADFNRAFPTTYVLGWGPNSARTFSSSLPLTSVDDFDGQRFRMPGNPIHLRIAQELGANPQVIPLGDLFTALETGVVNGQDNGMVTITSEGLFEVQDYVYETNHIIATLELVMNAEFLDGLTAEEQQIVREAAQATAEEAWDRYIESIDVDREFLRDQGVVVTEMTDAEREEMAERLAPLTEDLLAENDWAPDLVSRIQDVE